MRIGLFGGSFNPPHVCHVLASIWALQTRELERIWWIPTYRHAFGKELVDYEHRRRMCERTLERVDAVEISDVERDLGGESRTVETVRELQKRHPEGSFGLIVGADILEETDQWKDWEGLLDRVELIVVGRRGYRGEENLDEPVFALPDVSSTAIRDALRHGGEPWLEQWVPARVLEYIDENGLYRNR